MLFTMCYSELAVLITSRYGVNAGMVYLLACCTCMEKLRGYGLAGVDLCSNTCVAAEIKKAYYLKVG